MILWEVVYHARNAQQLSIRGSSSCGMKSKGVNLWGSQVFPNDCLGVYSHAAARNERLHDVCHNPVAVATVQRPCYVSPGPVQHQ